MPPRRRFDRPVNTPDRSVGVDWVIGGPKRWTRAGILAVVAVVAFAILVTAGAILIMAAIQNSDRPAFSMAPSLRAPTVSLALRRRSARRNSKSSPPCPHKKSVGGPTKSLRLGEAILRGRNWIGEASHEYWGAAGNGT